MLIFTSFLSFFKVWFILTSPHPCFLCLPWLAKRLTPFPPAYQHVLAEVLSLNSRNLIINLSGNSFPSSLAIASLLSFYWSHRLFPLILTKGSGLSRVLFWLYCLALSNSTPSITTSILMIPKPNFGPIFIPPLQDRQLKLREPKMNSLSSPNPFFLQSQKPDFPDLRYHIRDF